MLETETGVYFRGALTGVLSAIIANIVNFGLIALEFNSDIAAFFSIVVLGNLLAFTLDIVGAKRYFNGELISYNDFRTRSQLLLTAFTSFQFIKFLITIIIDGSIFNTLYSMARHQLDNLNISFPFRDPIIGVVLNALTYVTYLAPLRFYWAYVEQTSREFDLLMIAWASILLLLFSLRSQSLNRKIQLPQFISKRLPENGHPFLIR